MSQDRQPAVDLEVLQARITARNLSVQTALWMFLEGRRGEAFCSSCLRVALGSDRRIERELMLTEGRGAVRRHGPCALCGKDRLLCGLAA